MMKITHPIHGSYRLVGGDFANAGRASSELKSLLLSLGVSRSGAERAAVAAFEAEMNVIIHAAAGMLEYEINVGEINILANDMGPGIENIELAMQEGYSTAPDWVRDMGWGAGMGLSNMKKCSDRMRIDTVVGEGTTVEMKIYL
ncbi:MAG: hypothetical protein LLF86_01070 [Nitrospiraceae bacterium]|nr:hypothetical protein [Nitrospiraceae bacterium]